MIRKSTICDVDSIYWLCNIEPFTWNNYEPPYDKGWITNLVESGLVLVYETNGIIKGVICGEKLLLNGMMLWFLTVKKEFQNNIIGPKLYLQFEQECKNIGITWIYTLAYKTTENMLPIAGFQTNGKEYKEFVKDI